MKAQLFDTQEEIEAEKQEINMTEKKEITTLQELIENLRGLDAETALRSLQTQVFNLNTQANTRLQDCEILTNAIQRFNHVTPLSKGGLITITPYHGRCTDNWPNWIEEFEDTATACDWDDDRKLQIIPSYLKDQAKKRYKEALKELPVADRRHYTAVKQKLTEKLSTPEILSMKARGFQLCTQLAGESADSFATRLQDQFEAAYPNIAGGDRDRMLIDGFIKGIPDTIQALVSCSNPTNLAAAVSAARRLELLPRRGISQNSLATLFNALNTEVKTQSIATISGPTVLTDAEQSYETLKAKNVELQAKVDELLKQLEHNNAYGYEDSYDRGYDDGYNDGFDNGYDNYNDNNYNQNAYSSTYTQNQWTADGIPICNACGSPGHKAFECGTNPELTWNCSSWEFDQYNGNPGPVVYAPVMGHTVQPTTTVQTIDVPTGVATVNAVGGYNQTVKTHYDDQLDVLADHIKKMRLMQQ